VRRRTLKVLALAATVTVTLSLAACGGGGGSSSGTSSAAAAKGPITIWYSNNEQEVAWGKAMVSSWNAAHACLYAAKPGYWYVFVFSSFSQIVFTVSQSWARSRSAACFSRSLGFVLVTATGG